MHHQIKDPNDLKVNRPLVPVAQEMWPFSQRAGNAPRLSVTDLKVSNWTKVSDNKIHTGIGINHEDVEAGKMKY